MTSERTVVILDDEAPARERLTRLVDQLIGYRAIAAFSDGLDAIAQIEALKPDLALLDISMPGISGIEVAKHLSGFNNAPAIIFCTAYDQYAIEAFEAGAVGYLMKPVRLEKLDQALASASRLSKLQLAQLPEQPSSENSEPSEETLKVKSQRGIELIPLSEVLCFIADGKYVTARHLKGESLLEESLSQLEQQFSDTFVRCHRAALVRISSIQKLGKSADGSAFLTLSDDGENIPVSRRHAAQIREILLSRG
jgi:two-component system, LytTR family, response regulator AlgR